MSCKIKKYLFIILNIILPLIFGLVIYIFMKSGTYINTFLSIDFHYIPKTIIGAFIKNWFCDFLWSYALVFALFLVLSPFRSRLLISCIISALSGVVLEFLQGVNLLSGTFDWWDIAIELVAVIIAMLIIKDINKKNDL